METSGSLLSCRPSRPAAPPFTPPAESREGQSHGGGTGGGGRAAEITGVPAGGGGGPEASKATAAAQPDPRLCAPPGPAEPVPGRFPSAAPRLRVRAGAGAHDLLRPPSAPGEQLRGLAGPISLLTLRTVTPAPGTSGESASWAHLQGPWHPRQDTGPWLRPGLRAGPRLLWCWLRRPTVTRLLCVPLGFRVCPETTHL